ncbi:hypothetical protein TL16_g02146 [Triparma laevis f. inornata]|uniref:RBR-type E3 ubiquitin transferase n=1 Tax=Triparma laevis f. inornata TaxID=1714386 RepID=A0A9W6ZTN9_9STRA|nr:hypothetical protein TL16_g02146 [Triparma laevis f. inornata]
MPAQLTCQNNYCFSPRRNPPLTLFVLRQLLLLLLFSLPQTAQCATCRGAVLGSSLSSSSTTITSQSSTSVSFTGYNYNSAATKCHFKIQPTGNPQYIDISIENLPPFSGSLRFLTPESPTTSIILATQAANGVIKPFRAYSSTLTIEWDGTSDNLSQFSIRLSYSSPSYNPTVKGTGLNSENWPSHDPPYNVDNNTDALLLLHQASGIISSPTLYAINDFQQSTDTSSVSKVINPFLDYRWLITREPSDSKRLPSSVTLMCDYMYLPDPNDSITVYDGDSTDAPVVTVMTGTACRDYWIIGTSSSESSMLLVLRTDGSDYRGGFQFRWKADGEGARCSNLYPIHYTMSSGKFTDGTNSKSEMWRSTYCTWVIKPSSEPENVVIYFNRLGIKNSASIEIFEGFEMTSNNLLFSCMGCGKVAPMTFSTNKKGFTVTMDSKSTPGSGQDDSWGFEIEYYSSNPTQPVGAGDRTTHLISGSNNAVIPPPPPSAPPSGQRLLPQRMYEWKIIPPDLASQSDDVIYISFSRLDLPCTSTPGGAPNITIVDPTGTTGNPLYSTLPCGTTLPYHWFPSPRSASIILNGRGSLASIEFGYLSRASSYKCGYPDNLDFGVTLHPSFKLSQDNDWAGGVPSVLSYTYGLGNKREKVDSTYGVDLAFPTTSPSSSTSPPNLVDYWIEIPCPEQTLTIYPNKLSLPSSSTIGVYLGSSKIFLLNLTSASSLTEWITVNDNVHLRVNAPTNPFIFSFMHHSYYSDYSTTPHCGLPYPSIELNGPSFLFSDGSEHIALPYQNCTWKLKNAVLTFDRNNHPYGHLSIYDGEKMLFECFEAFYRSNAAPKQSPTNDPSSNWESLTMPGSVSNSRYEMEKWIWKVELGGRSKQTTSLKMGEIRGKPCKNSIIQSEVDLSGTRISQAQSFDLIKTCGILDRSISQNSTDLILEGHNLKFNPYKSAKRVAYANLPSFSDRRYYAETETDMNGTKTHHPVCRDSFEMMETQNVSSAFSQNPIPQAATCQFLISPKERPHNTKSDPKYTNIKLHSIDFPASHSFGVFAGTSEFGAPLFLCGPDYVFNPEEEGDTIYSNHGPIPPLDIADDVMLWKPAWWEKVEFFNQLIGFSAVCNEAPFQQLRSSCGSLFVKLSTNQTSLDLNITESTLPRFEADFFWSQYKNEEEMLDVPWLKCLDDPSWGEEPVVYEEPVYIIVFKTLGYLFSGCLVIAMIGGTYYYFEYWLPNQHLRDAKKTVKMIKPKKIPHATYTPIMNMIKNKFLKMGECSICFGDEKTFYLDGCGHQICPECLRSYVHTALGDASMFPIKCPMHHVGCLTVLEPKFSQRVLNKDEYNRFNLFNDRAVFGDGMACIFCGNFVIFPDRMGGVMVACPYCRQRFCMKCKIAWHVGVDCTNEGKDELEEWRKSHGATRCPGCFKVIEKEDAETCNHMVHKATDSIPCVQERTDFCYCCGLEVTSDYPHYEAINPSVNHFPDGVYNDCRVVLEGFSVAIQNKPKIERPIRIEELDDDGGIRDNNLGTIENVETTRTSRIQQSRAERHGRNAQRYRARENNTQEAEDEQLLRETAALANRAQAGRGGNHRRRHSTHSVGGAVGQAPAGSPSRLRHRNQTQVNRNNR